ncbi:MAG: hypothetical protein ACXVH3_30585 [Solirubrobacteraceae bacterium]
MWVFTTDGFLSAVEERRRDHRGAIVIRAREASALEALREIAPTLTSTVIYGDSDYRYRAWLGREEWANALAEIGRRVAYDNFKSEVLRRQGTSRYEEALHKVWSALGRTQPGGPYGTGGSDYPPAPEEEQPRRRVTDVD